jgi:hypothetical protein
MLGLSGMAQASPFTIPGTDYQPEIAVGPVVGSMGYGFEASVPLIPDYLNLNSGFTTFDISEKASSDGTPYRAKIHIGGIPLYASLYPFGRWFHIDAGMYFNDNRVSANAQLLSGNSVTIGGQTYSASGLYTFDGHTYSGAQIDSIEGRTHFNPIAPYLGFGINDPFRGGPMTFTMSAGAMFEGDANVRLSVPGVDLSTIPGELAYVDQQTGNINNKTSVVRIYPVLNLGLVYRF